MIDITVSGGEISEWEKDQYISHVVNRCKGHAVKSIDMQIDGEYVNLTWQVAPQRFNRIRRITGYLVGGMDRWNDAKTSEEADRVKHMGGAEKQ